MLLKEDSNEIDQKIENIIAAHNEAINNNEKINYGIRLKATGAFVYRALLAKYRENQDEYNQEDVYREFAKIMRIEDKNLKSYELANIIPQVASEGEVISDIISECAQKIKDTYLESEKQVYCVSTKKGLKEILPVIRASNYYKAGTSEAIIGASNYEKILDEIAEECVDGKVKRAGKYIIYANNPFKKDDKSGEIKLNREISVYAIDSKNFEPVLNYRMDKNYNGIISFDREWISRAESENVLKETSVSTISKDFFRNRQVFVQNSNLDVIKQIEYNEDEEEVLNIIEMLIEEGELEYLNLDYNVGIDERLKNAKEKSDKRRAVAKETMKLIDAEKIETYLRDSISYGESEIQEIREIEIKTDDIEDEEEKSDSKEATRKDIIGQFIKIDPVIGIKLGLIYLKNKKAIEDIVSNGTNKELIAFYVDRLIGTAKSEKDKAVITDLVYYQTQTENEDIHREELLAIKEKNEDLLALIYFRENGISEDSIYSFIIDCCDDDLDSYKNKMNRIKDIVEKDEIEKVKLDVERYLISNKLAKQFETNPKEMKRRLKDFFRKNDKVTLFKSDNENKDNLERNKGEKRVPENSNLSAKYAESKNYKCEEEQKTQKKRKREEMDI